MAETRKERNIRNETQRRINAGDTKLADASLDAEFAVGTFTLTGSGKTFSCDTGSMLNCSSS